MEGDAILPSQSTNVPNPSADRGQADDAAIALAQDEAHQFKEELRVLMFGFATGMTVAAVFFVYILLATARVLP